MLYLFYFLPNFSYPKYNYMTNRLDVTLSIEVKIIIHIALLPAPYCFIDY